MSLRVDYSVLNQRETPSLFADVFSNRPAFGFNGRLFISIDTKQIFRDYGTSWELIADAGSGSSNLQQVCTNGNFTTTDIDMLSGNLILRNLNPGGVLFTNTSEIVSQDINNFFWDDTNNRLGIGTNTPTAPLDVHSTGNILQQLNGTSTNNTYLAFLNQDIGKWRIGNYYNSGDNDFVIYDTFSGVTRAFFTNTGYTILPTNLIIGSSNRSSAYGMDVYVSANYQSTLRVQGASTFLSQINGTFGVFSNTITTPQVQASTSAGLSLNANSGTQVALLGAGGSSGITLFGGLSGTSATFSTTLGVTGLISGTTATLTSSLFDQFILTGGTSVSTRINIKRGTDDSGQNMLIGYNQIKLQNLSQVITNPQLDFSIVQEGSNGSRTPFYITSTGVAFIPNKLGIGASSDPVYNLEVSSTGGSQRIRVGTLQNNDNTPKFEAITSNGNTIGNSAWLKVNDGGGFTLGSSQYTKTGGDSGNFANLSAEVETNSIFVSTSNNVLIGTTTDAGQKLQVEGTAKFKNNVTFDTYGNLQSQVTNLGASSTKTVTITGTLNGTIQIMVSMYGNGSGSQSRAMWMGGGYLGGSLPYTEITRVNGGTTIISAITSNASDSTFTIQNAFAFNSADATITVISCSANQTPITITIS